MDSFLSPCFQFVAPGIHFLPSPDGPDQHSPRLALAAYFRVLQKRVLHGHSNLLTTRLPFCLNSDEFCLLCRV